MVDTFEDHSWKDIVSSETLEIYKAYKRKTYVAERPALLAIDLYNLAFDGGPKPVIELVNKYPSSCGIHAWNAIKPIQELFSVIRSKEIPVIYTTSDIRTGSKPSEVHATHRKIQHLPDTSYNIKEELMPEPKDIIIYKQRASGFFGTPLITHLTRLGVNCLIVCGESTSGCVRATVVDGYSFGFHIVVVEECCFDRHILSHKISLFDMHHKYADVMHFEEVKDNIQRL